MLNNSHNNSHNTLKKSLFLILILGLGFCSCTSKKKYSDYKPTDFYEVQGIIESASPTKDPFDSSVQKDIRFTYFLDREHPISNTEHDLEMFEAQSGYPLIVLVHKTDETISFYGRVGILDSLNLKEKNYLAERLSE